MWFRKKTNKPLTPVPLGTCIFKSVALDEWQSFRAFYLRALKQDPTCSADDYEDLKALPTEDWKALIEESLTVPGSLLAEVVSKESGAIVGMVHLAGRSEAKRAHESDVHFYMMTEKACSAADESVVWEAIFDHFAKNTEVERIKIAIHSKDRDAILLFNNLGFKRYGYDEHFFRIGKKYLDAILMLKQL